MAEPSIRNPGHLEEALHRAVFTESAMHDEERDVDAAIRRRVAVGSRQSHGAADRRAGLNANQTRIARACEQSLLVLGQPTSHLVDADEHRFELRSIERGQHIARGQNGYLVFG